MTITYLVFPQPDPGLCSFFFFFFLGRPFLKSSLNLLQYCFCFMFGFWPEACRILVPQPGMEPMPHALEGKVLITEPLGKSPGLCSFHPLLLFSHSVISDSSMTTMGCCLSSVHGIFQARILEWVAISYSRGIFPTQGVNPCLLCCKQILNGLMGKTFRPLSYLISWHDEISYLINPYFLL